MKTIKEWLETLKEPYRSRALRNMDCNNLEETVVHLSEALQAAFIWNNSTEGHKYWDELFYKIYENED